MSLTETCNRHPLAFALVAFALSVAAFNVMPAATLAGMVAQTALAAACALLCLAVGRPRWAACWKARVRTLDARRKRRLLRSLAGASLCLAGIAAATGLLGVALPAATVSAPATLLAPATAAALFLVLCLLTGTFEESLFRGILFGAFATAARTAGKSRPILLGALVSSAVFGLLHVTGTVPDASAFPDQPAALIAVAQFVFKPLQAALFGFVMAAVYARSGSLALAIGLHAAFNALSEGPAFLLAQAVPTTYLTGDPADLAVLAVGTALLAPLALGAKRRLAALDCDCDRDSNDRDHRSPHDAAANPSDAPPEPPAPCEPPAVPPACIL